MRQWGASAPLYPLRCEDMGAWEGMSNEACQQHVRAMGKDQDACKGFMLLTVMRFLVAFEPHGASSSR